MNPIKPTYHVLARGVAPGVYDSEALSPPTLPGCKHVLVRPDGSLGWCEPDGTQPRDENGAVSWFMPGDLATGQIWKRRKA